MVARAGRARDRARASRACVLERGDGADASPPADAPPSRHATNAPAAPARRFPGWPVGLGGWTVVARPQPQPRRRASRSPRRIAADGVQVGVLDSTLASERSPRLLGRVLGPLPDAVAGAGRRRRRCGASGSHDARPLLVGRPAADPRASPGSAERRPPRLEPRQRIARAAAPMSGVRQTLGTRRHAARRAPPSSRRPTAPARRARSRPRARSRAAHATLGADVAHRRRHRREPVLGHAAFGERILGVRVVTGRDQHQLRRVALARAAPPRSATSETNSRSPDPGGTGRLTVNPSPSPSPTSRRAPGSRVQRRLVDRDEQDLGARVEDVVRAVAVVDVPVERSSRASARGAGARAARATATLLNRQKPIARRGSA